MKFSFGGITVEIEKNKKLFEGMEVYNDNKQLKKVEKENKVKDSIEKIGSGLKNIWNKTIFPDIIKNKREDKEFKKQIKAEAITEARKETEEILKNQFKQEYIDKIKGVKKSGGKNFMKKLAKGFGYDENNLQPSKQIDVAGMMGMGNNTETLGVRGMGYKYPKNINKKKKNKKQVQQKSPFDYEDKIKEMLR